jgi:hypothetical protein
MAHIGPDEQRFRAKTQQFGFKGLSLPVSPAGHHNAGTQSGEFDRSRTSDPSQRAGNQYNLVIHVRSPINAVPFGVSPRRRNLPDGVAAELLVPRDVLHFPAIARTGRRGSMDGAPRRHAISSDYR